ncbi:MAG: hypothetical protein NVSMB52_12270 [Chloroflexota bacterium]
MGLAEAEVRALNPCVPGEFTVADNYYVNTATPRTIYRGSEEGTLPMVPGRWYIIPARIVGTHSELARDTVPVAHAVRLAR